MKLIAKKEAKYGKELEYIVEKHIEEFEKQYGEIIVDWMTPKEIAEDIKFCGNFEMNTI